MNVVSTVDNDNIVVTLSDSRSVSVRTIHIHPEVNKTCFLIHGSMANKNQFNHLINNLKSCPYNIISYDAYGCGNSDKPHVSSAYTPEAHLRDLIEIYEKYSTDENILIGHSFGTSQIARLCKYIKSSTTNDQNNNIHAVILLGTTFHIDDGGHPIFKSPLFILNCLQGYLSRQFLTLAFSPKTSEDIKNESMISSNKNDMFVVKSFYSNFKWARPEEWLTLLSYPLLVIHGADDKLLPLEGAQQLIKVLLEKRESTSKHIKEGQPSPRIVLEVINDAGHQIMVEKPEETFQIIKKFLEENSESNRMIDTSDISTILNNDN